MSENAPSDRRKRAFRIESGAQRVQRDVDEEMEFHLAMRTQKLIKLGLSPQAAREEALKQFGDFTTVRTECIAINREHHRAMNRVNRLQDLKQDITYAIRSLGNNKGFAAITVLILALGIGSNTAMFSLIDVLLLRSLPVPHAERLVTIGNPNRVGAVSQGWQQNDLFSYELYKDVRNGTKSLSGVYATGRNSRVDFLRQGDSAKAEPDHPSTRFVSGNYFSVLQKPVAEGRAFLPTEDQVSGDAPVVVIGYRYWQSRFAGDRAAIGSIVTINGAPFTIVGVAAQDFDGDLVDRVIDVFIPLTMQPVVNKNTEWLPKRKVCWLQVMGRLAPGYSIEQVRAELSPLVTRSIIDHAKADEIKQLEADMREKPLLVESGAQGFSIYRSTYTKSLYTLMAAVALVLLVVCANVANLLLARATARAREMSVRMALGASRVRLVQQLLTESLIIAFAGGTLGLVVATWGSKGLLKLANGQSPSGIMLDTSLNGRVLGFSLVVSLLTAALFGLMPALRSTRVELATALRSSGRNVTGTGGKFSAGRMLVVAQVALSVLLLVGTGMLLRSMQQLDNADVGADRSHLLVASIEAQALGYKEVRLAGLMDDIVRRVRQVPGVVDATVSENGIFSGTESGTSITVEGFVARQSEDTSVAYDDVGSSYFHAVGAKMIEGRDFNEHDNESGPKTIIINASMAKFFFPNGSAVGRRIINDSASREIVGVVADINGTGLREKPARRLYFPMKQFHEPPPNFYLLVRTSGDPAKATTGVRNAILAADPLLPLRRVNALSELIRDSISQDRLVAQVVTMFGALTLILSALGLYGVMAYATLRRTSEFGLRLALGAVPGSIVRMVLRDALGLTALGLIVGLPLAYGMSRLLHEQFFGIGTIDVPSLVLAIVVLSGAATLAGYVPAMRASRVAPLDALRSD